MTEKYKKRNLDESIELAQSVFKSKVADFLSPEEMEEMKNFGAIVAGSINSEWKNILGFEPQSNEFYEIEIYKPSDEKPYAEKIFAKILVTRDSSSNRVEIIWKPKLAD